MWEGSIPDFKKCKFLHRGFYLLYSWKPEERICPICKYSVQMEDNRGRLISQFWQDNISRGFIFATVTGKYEKRALKFAI